MKNKPSWIGQYAAFNDALKYMYARSTGEEKSIINNLKEELKKSKK